jgi:hypothetical protein
MTFDGRCIVVHFTDVQWYVAVAPVAQPGADAVISKPLGRRAAFRACKELNELEEGDWSEATRGAMLPSPPVYRI